MKFRFVEPGLVGGEHVAGDGRVELQPDLVSLLVDVPGSVERTLSSLNKSPKSPIAPQ